MPTSIVGLYAADLAGQRRRVGRVGVVDHAQPRQQRQQARDGHAEAVERRQEAEHRVLPRRTPGPRSPPRWLLSMLRCVSGTALGAFSEPLVNSTTAGACGIGLAARAPHPAG